MLIVEMPDNVSAAVFAMAVAASGAVRLFQTTPLLTIAEGVEALQKASESEYEPPTSHIPRLALAAQPGREQGPPPQAPDARCVGDEGQQLARGGWRRYCGLGSLGGCGDSAA